MSNSVALLSGLCVAAALSIGLFVRICKRSEEFAGYQKVPPPVNHTPQFKRLEVGTPVYYEDNFKVVRGFIEACNSIGSQYIVKRRIGTPEKQCYEVKIVAAKDIFVIEQTEEGNENE